MELKIYQTKVKKLSGTSYDEVYPQAISIYKKICSKTKRRPHIRSKFFKKEKIFLDYFWDHLRTKNPRDRSRRLKYYECALDLIKNSKIPPTSKINPNKSSEILHRFTGKTENNDPFYVQITEHIRKKNKHLTSVFPIDLSS